MFCCFLIYLVPPIFFIWIFRAYFPNRSKENENDSRNNYNETYTIKKRATAPKYTRLPIGELTLENIGQYNGINNKRIFISICGRIFDVSSRDDFYGPSCTYNCFAGGDASFMLGKMSFNPNERNKQDFTTINWNNKSQQTLSDWVKIFCKTYPLVGRLKDFQNVGYESWNQVGFCEQENKENHKMTLKDLQTKQNLISVAGYVFDVSSASMVYDHHGEIPDAIGNDITFALMKNEFKTEYYNQPLTFIDGNHDKERVKSYLKSFCETYPIVGRLTNTEFEIKLDVSNENDDDWHIVGTSVVIN